MWNGDIQYDKLKLVVSDQASYMLKAIQSIKMNGMYPNINHITCLIHALHKVCGNIREENKQVNKLISAMKKILRKSNKQKVVFRQQTGLNLPPDIIIT